MNDVQAPLYQRLEETTPMAAESIKDVGLNRLEVRDAELAVAFSGELLNAAIGRFIGLSNWMRKGYDKAWFERYFNCIPQEMRVYLVLVPSWRDASDNLLKFKSPLVAYGAQCAPLERVPQTPFSVWRDALCEYAYPLAEPERPQEPATVLRIGIRTYPP